MANVKCAKCNQEREGFTEAPMPGPMGENAVKMTCTACWAEWMEMSTKIINEYRLQLFRPDHRKTLEEQMKVFLNFPV